MIAETLKNEDMGWETEENRHGMIRDGAQGCYGRTHNYKLFTNGQSKKKKRKDLKILKTGLWVKNNMAIAPNVIIVCMIKSYHT